MTGKIINFRDKGKPKAKNRWVPAWNGNPPRIPPWVKKMALQGGNADDGDERVRDRAEKQWLNIHGEVFTKAKLDAERAKKDLDEVEAKIDVLEKLIADEEKYVMQEETKAVA